MRLPSCVAYAGKVIGLSPRQAAEQGLAALRAHDPVRSAALLRDARAGLAASEFPWLALAQAELMLGRFAEAGEVLDQLLLLAPRDLAALLQRAHVHEKCGNARAAVAFYQSASQQAALQGGGPPHLAALLGHGEAFCRASGESFIAQVSELIGPEASPAMREAADLLAGKRQIDLQQPSVFYYPGLPQRRFYEPEDFPWFEPMLALLPQMQAELAGILGESASDFAPYVQQDVNRPAIDHHLVDDPSWSAFYFWQGGEVVEANARRCPATMEALSYPPMPVAFNRAPNAHWSRLLPGAHIVPHVGMLNTRLICHIPIMTAPDCWLRVGSERRGWEDGVPLIFDDSIEHEARNEGSQERVILLFEIWRPEVPEEDRDAIARLFSAIGEMGL